LQRLFSSPKPPDPVTKAVTALALFATTNRETDFRSENSGNTVQSGRFGSATTGSEGEIDHHLRGDADTLHAIFSNTPSTARNLPPKDTLAPRGPLSAI
jgi:hypothetical protein